MARQEDIRYILCMDKGQPTRIAEDAPGATATLDTPRSLRVRLCLTQADVARKARITTRTLRQIESALSVRMESIHAVALVLGVSDGALLDAMRQQARAARLARFGGRRSKAGA